VLSNPGSTMAEVVLVKVTDGLPQDDRGADQAGNRQ
jgi:hypothetical protein